MEFKLEQHHILYILAHKKLKINGKIYTFNKKAIDKIRRLFKTSKYYGL